MQLAKNNGVNERCTVFEINGKCEKNIFWAY
jgi:hypothetical protein